jgi:hypothetical protein
LPSTSSSFRPTSRPSSCTRSPAPLPPSTVGLLSPAFCVMREGGRRRAFCPKPPALFPLIQNRPPLFPSLFSSKTDPML